MCIIIAALCVNKVKGFKVRNLILLITISTLFFGCAEMPNAKLDAQRQEISSYVDTNRPLAESGGIKWSNYYRGLYDKFSASSFNDKGFMMTVFAESLEKAQLYESEKITKDEFEVFRLKQNARIAEHSEQLRQAQPAPQQVEYKPTYIDPELFRNKQAPRVNCTSYRIGNTVQTDCR